MARTKMYSEEAVLDKAMQLFWQQGYHNTSVDELVAAMGINRASLYSGFGDKESLYLKALQRYKTKNDALFEVAVQAEPDERQKIKILLMQLVHDALADAENKGCFCTNAALEMTNCSPTVKSHVRKSFAEMQAYLENTIAQGQQKGHILSQTPARTLALLVHCTFGGVQVLAKTRPPAAELHAVIQQIMLLVK